MKRSRSVQQQKKVRMQRMERARKKMEADRRSVHSRIKHIAQSSDTPMFRACNMQYEIAERSQLSTLPSRPLHCRATPTDFVPFFAKAEGSKTMTI